MAATSEERQRFGERLRALREMADVTAAALAEQMTRLKHPTEAASITAWERGEYAPRRRATVELLEGIFNVGDGELQHLLGYGLPIDKQEERFSQIEQRLEGIEETLQELLRRRRRGAAE